MTTPDDAEQRKTRAEELRDIIDDARRGNRESSPVNPREFTDRAANEARENR